MDELQRLDMERIERTRKQTRLIDGLQDLLDKELQEVEPRSQRIEQLANAIAALANSLAAIDKTVQT